MRVLDPSGATKDLILAAYPDAEIDQSPDGFYDAIMFHGDLDNMLDPDERLKNLTEHIAPGGRLYASVRQGRNEGGHTFGRKRAWRGVDVAALLRKHGRIVDFQHDKEGYLSGVIEPLEKRGEVTIFTGQAIGGWHPKDIEQQGLGGSETAAWRLAEELSNLGYVVTLYGDFQEQGAVMPDVILRHWMNFDPTRHQHATIVFRSAEPFDKPVNASKTILWLEDVAGAEGLTEARAERIDYVCGVTGWHKENIEDTHPWLDPRKVIASRNGITHEFFDGEPVEREKRLLYTSSPDRGLDIVLECWPEIKRQVPDATFVHCYSRWWDLVANHNAVSAAHRARVEEMSRADGVEKAPSLGQRKLAELMRSSMVWCHPSYYTLGSQKFNETNCISAQEAQAAGCVVVASNWGALAEVVKTGVKLDGEPMSDLYRARFIQEIVKGLTDPAVQRKAQVEGPKAMADRGWGPVAKQLEGLIRG
jgi:glycosyltransferase involved in cell wall biosynthesis